MSEPFSHLSSNMRLHPINPAEAIIAPFFDPALSPEGEWILEGGAGTRGLRTSRAYTTLISWDAAEPDSLACAWSWQGRLEVTGYDGLFLQAALPPWVTLRVTAQVDGRSFLIAEGRGTNGNADYAGPFEGRILEAVRLEFTSHTADAGSFNTYYLGVHNARRLDDWLAFENPRVYDPAWPGYIKPEAEWGQVTPQLELYFDAAGLDALRRKLEQEPYRSFAEVLRRQAYEALKREPEREIRRYMACGEAPYAYSARDRDRASPFWRAMEQCAFFGMLDREPRLTRMAARFAICLAHVGHWAESFVEHDFPGSAVNWRSFFQTTACVTLAATLDWAGAALTDHAKDVIDHSLYFKGLTLIKFDFARYEYIYHMNQAAVFSPGRISALLALNRSWPRLGWEIDQAGRDLDETMAHLMGGDGCYGEGPSYFSATMHYGLLSYLLLARYRGVPATEVIPPAVLAGADYFGMYVSTAAPAAALPLADGGMTLNSDWLAFFASATDDPRWIGLLAGRLADNMAALVNTAAAQVWLGSSVRTLIYGPAELTARAPMTPLFKINAGTGHATSCRPTPWGNVRLHVSGASAAEGHSHADKGALILEAFGEALLIDRGITAYNDPLAEMFQQARLHNVVTLELPDGRALDQINPCPAAVAPRGSGDERALHLSLDVTPAWAAPVQQMVRTVESSDPLHFTITDRIVLAEPAAAIFHLHTYAPISVAGSTAVFAAQRSRLSVTWEWEGEVVCAGVELCDGNHAPVYHLAVRSRPAIEHTLVTRMKLMPEEAAR